MTYKPSKLGQTDLVYWFVIRVRQQVRMQDYKSLRVVVATSHPG